MLERAELVGGQAQTVSYYSVSVSGNFGRAGCHVRRALAEQFATAARLFSEAAVELAISGTSEERHMRLRKAAAAAQQRAKAALVSYEEHVGSHRCLAFVDNELKAAKRP